MDIKYMKPDEIEKRSMELIEQEMSTVPAVNHAPIIRRVIHTTADFDYEHSLMFSESAVAAALKALRAGTLIITDTNMARAGINKPALARHSCEAICFMSDPDVAAEASSRGLTRAAVSMEKAAKLDRPAIFAIGNAPTALMRLRELIDEGAVRPQLIIGVPVGFVNVTESKEFILQTDVPHIVARGRKGGSTVAAAICNALLYMADDESY